MDIEIRKVDLSDLGLLLEWRMRVLSEAFADYENHDADIIRENNEKYYMEHLKNDTHTACFAIDRKSEKVVGCGGICYQKEMPSPDNITGTNGFLMNIFCVPEYRGNGTGRKIIEYLVNDARNRGTEKIYLESSEIAKDLYKEIGFLEQADYMILDRG